ncbi:MAG: aspartate carbamoyltransferase regulatory subunit [Treponemataceae bacterium]|nr:aspartate carbamoyltransferase regulatory subunit [Treponemataceae bacterium]
MLNVDTIKNGLVIDHIRAGTGPRIFQWLKLDKADFCVALIMNAPSKTMGRKDIIKIDNIINIDYSVLGFIDPNITVNIVKDEHIAKKITLSLPDKVENIIKCKNPRCITSTETYVHHTFHLVDRTRAEYRCEFCDELYRAGTGEGLQ